MVFPLAPTPFAAIPRCDPRGRERAPVRLHTRWPCTTAASVSTFSASRFYASEYNGRGVKFRGRRGQSALSRLTRARRSHEIRDTLP